MMPANGFLVSSTLAKTLAVLIFGIGAWVTAIQFSVDSKADKNTVDVAIATQTGALKNIDKALTTMAASLKSLDERQRESDLELARLKAKAEAEDK